MSAGNYDIVIEQGADYGVTLTLKDSSGTLIDLTDYTARMDIREKVDSETAILSLTEVAVSGNVLTLGAGAGTIVITIKAATTAAMDFETAVYDLAIRDSGDTNDVTRVIAGQVTLDREVTTTAWT